MRYSFIFYRDRSFQDDQEDVDDDKDNFNFCADIDKFKDHVKTVKTFGGDDIPEDMMSGLSKGLQQKFESNIKAAFLIFDAPSHGKDYHDDNIPDNNPDSGETIEQFVKEYAEKSIYMGLLMLGRKNFYTAQKTYDAILNEYQRNQKSDHIYQLKIDSIIVQDLNDQLDQSN
ncbi:hypothetical protein ABPG72_021022 [Tetrahymena utriculariae]